MWTQSPAAQAREPSPLAFFVLVLVLAVPFWVLGALTGVELLPGLPIAALSFICPVLAGLILAWREGGHRGARSLLARAVDVRRIRAPGAWAAALLIPPGVAIACWLLARLGGSPIPAPQFAIAKALGLVAIFLLAATGEELGWSGYVLDPLQSQWGPLRASLILGAVWIVFHYVPLAQEHRSMAWVAWWSLGSLSMRVIMVWLYNRVGRSVFAVSVFHMAANLAWQLYPVSGSWFDPRSHGLLMALVAVVAVLSWRSAAISHPAR
jgi:hypothetical protein